MILIGDKLVPYEPFSHISTISQIASTKANSVLLFTYNETLMKYCYENELSYAVEVGSLKEAIYANALNACFIIAQKKEAKRFQKVAQNYLFDSKILAIIKSNEELEEIAQDEVDGVIFKNLLDKN